ncbi:MAG: spore maturation protein, partial [Alphaproteobacteria bacterium]|nr:spore maturation protein [Alphaproteobacteria bacterium]
MNGIFLGIVLVAFVASASRQLDGQVSASGRMPMEALGQAMIEAAGTSVTLAIGMVGVMALFLGVMKVAEKGGLLVVIARTVRPLMVRLFPGVPAAHPAMGAMVLNISANVLGLGNAATPFGIRAMQELDRLNPHKGTASDPMVMFLAINTSSVTLLPTGVIALRAAAGSQDSAGIISTTLFATIVSTAVAIVSVFLLRRFFPLPPAGPVAEPGNSSGEALPPEAGESYPFWAGLLALAAVVA